MVRPEILKKVFAFIGLLGVVYALALQHGLLSHSPSEALATAQAAQREAASPVADSPPARVGTPAESSGVRTNRDCDEAALSAAYRNHQSHIEVCGRGTVAKVLKDDTHGTRHQRFIVRVPPRQTVLIAYNYDLAPRIDGLRPGAPIEFVGEYEWNGQGGVVHWTHRDPGGHHLPGWIRYGGRQYQ